MVGALESLLRTQNQFLAGWLNYYADRMRLARELGTMQLESNGQWIKVALPGSPDAASEVPDNLPALPPSIPPPPAGDPPPAPPAPPGE